MRPRRAQVIQLGAGMTLDEAIHEVDLALYQAKHGGAQPDMPGRRHPAVCLI